ncbi:protein ENHANCED DISEASE RESISTANCE 4 [Neltuma alba]|uniref:protein ENHANCED DISEASE RESISTANCE 4 n=1 Tax=Neltuma alba TaxID=207710 RepID=UPI0010A4FAE4|nr:protein ENHANCED DISEASE RESISTANCE 4 [Prosopis alba]
MSASAKVRLVRCPKCDNLLPELADYSLYQCGGCGAVLRAKHKGNESGSLLEKSDEGKIVGESAKSENSSDVDVKSNSDSPRHINPKDSDKENNNGHERLPSQSKDSVEKGDSENGLDMNRKKDVAGKATGREQEESQPHNTDSETRSKFSGRMSDWQNGERWRNEGFWRKLRTDVEGARFSTTNYPDEGTSNNYSSFSYGEQWRNQKDMNAMDTVQHLEQDRAELLKKLDELKDQLTQSCEVSNNPKEKAGVDGRMVPPDPYVGSDAWLPDAASGLNRTSGQFLRPDKHNTAGPSYINYHHDPFAYPNGQDMMGMPNFHPSMHNPNHIFGYGDPYASQMLRRGPHNLSHQFPQPPLHPHFPKRYVDPSPDSYDPYMHNTTLHPPSCSCFRCYENQRRASAPVPPAAFINNRYPDNMNDPMLYRHEILGTYGPHVHNSRSTIPPVSFPEAQSHSRWASDLNPEMAPRSRPRKVMLATASRRCHPIAGGSPFITCYNCFELLQLPKKVLVKNHQQKVQCGACSSEISFAVINKKLVISPHSEVKGLPPRVDDSMNVVASSRMSHSHGANFSSDDYSGYDFHSVDREPVSSLPGDPSLNSSKSQEMHSYHSSSPSTSEDENSPEAAIASREIAKSIQQPTKTSLSPPPAGSPLQEYFDYSSNNNNAVNRFGKGNRSSRSEQERVKSDKTTLRQNSLKEGATATEMDVHDYSNTGVSQDSGDASQEHGHSRSKKGGDSFFTNIKKSLRDFSKSNQTDKRSSSNVTVNGHPIPDRVIKKAEKLAGPIQPGNYWYDIHAGFWGVMGGPCLGIIMPSIEEFNYPMPENCSGGTTGVFVNGRELHQKDLDLLAGRGLPLARDRSYIIDISGRIHDEDTGEELDGLGKLAPTVEKVKHGFGMKLPRSNA